MPDHELLGIAAGVLAFATIIPYAWDIIGGITKPNVVTYFVWTVLQAIAIAGQYEAGASWSVFLLIGTTVNTGLIFLLAIAGYGYKEYTRADTIAIVLAVPALLILAFTHHPVLAILLPVIADGIGAIPTLVKTRKHPETEERLAWFLMIVASALGILATEKLDVANLLYPSFLLVEAVVIFCLAFFGKRTLVCRWGRGCRAP